MNFLHPAHHLILPGFLVCLTAGIILSFTHFHDERALASAPPIDGVEPVIERDSSMTQLWQMIKQILGITGETDARVAAANEQLAAHTTILGTILAHQDAQSMVIENAIQAFAGNAQDFGKGLLGIHGALEDINLQLSKLLGIAQRIQSAVMPLVAERIVFHVGGNEVTQMQLKDNGVLDVSISATDAEGNPATLDPTAVPSWAVSDPALASISPSSDGLTAKVVPVGPLGSFDVQCSIPAAGDEPALSGSLPVEVIASAATTIVLNGAVE